MERWSEESGIPVNHTSAGGDQEMINILQQNAGEIDLCNPAALGFALGRAEGLFSEIEYDRVPNYDNIAEEWNRTPLLEGENDGLFYHTGSQGLAYDPSAVDDLTSWQAIKDDQYEGAVGLADTVQARFGNAAAAIGADVNELPEDDDLFEEVAAEIEAQHRNVFNYWSAGDQFMQWLREGQADIVEAWGGRIVGMQEDGHDVEYTIPEEGCITWPLAFAIPEASDNEDTAYELLDRLYERDRLLELSDLVNYLIFVEDPPAQITELPDYTEHPDDFIWIDWQNILPLSDRMAQPFNEIVA